MWEFIKKNKISFIFGAILYTTIMILLLLRRFGSDPSYKTWEPLPSIIYEFTGILFSNLFNNLNFPLGSAIPLSLPILLVFWVLIGGFLGILIKYVFKRLTGYRGE